MGFSCVGQQMVKTSEESIGLLVAFWRTDWRNGRRAVIWGHLQCLHGSHGDGDGVENMDEHGEHEG